jgi:magnesium-transporting ATPase (P-type)
LKAAIQNILDKVFRQNVLPDEVSGKYFINKDADFSEIERVECKIKKFPGGERRYGIKRTDGSSGKKTTAFRLRSYLFVFNKYKFFTLSIFALIVITLISKPIFTILSVAGTYFIVRLLRPFRSNRNLKKAYYTVLFSMVALVVAGFFVVSKNTASPVAASLANGFLYIAIDSMAIFFFLGLIEKYDEIYALDIEDYNDWTDAEYFLWRGREDEPEK